MIQLKHLLLGMPLIAACLDSTPTETPSTEDDDGENISTEEGAYGRVRVRTPDGPMTLSYQVVNGQAVHELDMELGPVSELRNRGGAANLAERWTDGLIRYGFDESLAGLVCEANLTNCVNARDRIRQTLAEMETRLPLHFVEVSADTLGGCVFPTPSCNGVVFRYVAGLDAGGKSSHTGMEGGVQYVSFLPGHEGDATSPLFLYSLQPVPSTIRHEVLHSAGLFHEQSRNDRNEFIMVNYQNIIDGTSNGNYAIKDESADLGPYDFASIMHYGTSAKCLKIAGVCIGPTMEPLDASATIKTDATHGGFSIEDVNTVYRMYAKPTGKNDAGDEFGKVFARGDFDGDGYDDLAVGIPGEDLASGTFPNLVTQPNAGMVSVWKGTSFGLVAWMQLTQQSFSGQNVTANAKFGAALAAYDANGDGASDLAVGAPGALGTAGAVFVFKGSRERNLVEHRMLTQTTENLDDNMAGDRFGEALAGGSLTNLLRVDACGPNAIYDALAVGAPGDTSNGSTAPRGAVFIYQETLPSCSSSSSMNKPTVLRHNTHTGAGSLDDFGASLAMGDVDGDGKADLAVGAPLFNSGKGKVYLYQGLLPTPVANPFGWSAMAVEADQLEAGLTTRFGSAIVIGDILPFGRQVVVGAPGGIGKVVIFSAASTMNVSTIQTLTDSTPKDGDEFGAALGIGNIDHLSESEDLVVGVPGEDSQAGAVVVFRGGTVGLPVRSQILQSQMPFADRETGDRFGAALSLGNFDGADGRLSTANTGVRQRDLVIGAPGEKPEISLGVESPNRSGAFDFYKGGAITLSPRAHRHQEVAGRASDP